MRTTNTPALTVGDVLSFDVTAFLTQAINQHASSANLGIQALMPGAVEFMLPEAHPYPRLIVTTTVPELTSFWMCLIGLAGLGLLHRLKAPALPGR